MRICLLVLSVVLLQAVAINAQSSTIDQIMSTANSLYDMYRSGDMASIARQYLQSAMQGLESMTNQRRQPRRSGSGRSGSRGSQSPWLPS